MSLKRSGGSTPGIGSQLSTTALDDLTDVDVTTTAPEDGDMLHYVAGEYTQVITPVPTATANAGSNPENTVDGDTGTYFQGPNYLQGTVTYLDYDFGGAVTLSRVQIYQYSTSYDATSWELFYSNNGTDYVSLGTKSVGGVATTAIDFGTQSHRYWRVKELDTSTYTGWRLNEVTFWVLAALWVPTAPGVFAKADASALPVIELTQSDVDEDFFKFTGTSDTSADRALVDAANFTTPGSIVGWLKINVVDDQSTAPITDGDYYIPFYSAPTA